MAGRERPAGDQRWTADIRRCGTNAASWTVVCIRCEHRGVTPHALVGRDAELRALLASLDGAKEGGGALVLSGAAGIGKSALLGAATAEAVARGSRVLTVTGVPAEGQVPYEGLRRLLAETGFAETGFAAGDFDGGPLRTAMTVLHRLSALAGETPVVLAVEDAHWLDEPSWEALAFVGRRLRADPIVLLATLRDDADSQARIAASGLPALTVPPLSDQAAAELLTRVAPELGVALRARVLAEAAGNPLALMEFAALASRQDQEVLASSRLPLTERLERVRPGDGRTARRHQKSGAGRRGQRERRDRGEHRRRLAAGGHTGRRGRAGPGDPRGTGGGRRHARQVPASADQVGHRPVGRGRPGTRHACRARRASARGRRPQDLAPGGRRDLPRRGHRRRTRRRRDSRRPPGRGGARARGAGARRLPQRRSGPAWRTAHRRGHDSLRTRRPSRPGTPRRPRGRRRPRPARSIPDHLHPRRRPVFRMDGRGSVVRLRRGDRRDAGARRLDDHAALAAHDQHTLVLLQSTQGRPAPGDRRDRTAGRPRRSAGHLVAGEGRPHRARQADTGQAPRVAQGESAQPERPVLAGHRGQLDRRVPAWRTAARRHRAAKTR
ncbi:ATP-binding protein [Streptosporangiaceae bacterium NEAU-GS5]|nr:ATP-binding protein [Streptosporangiaceae bacterium NEAU-GS5]